MLCALYEPDSGRLTYAHAGHPLGTLIRMDSSLAIGWTMGPAVGVVPEAEYVRMCCTFRARHVALYTDGVVEAARRSRCWSHAHRCPAGANQGTRYSAADACWKR